MMTTTVRVLAAAALALLVGCRSKPSEPAPAPGPDAGRAPVGAEGPAVIGSVAQAGSSSAAPAAVLGDLGPLDPARPTPAGQTPAEPAIEIAERGTGAAWVAESGGKSRVVHGGRAGAAYQALGKVILSPDGKRCAYAAQRDGAWRMIVDGAEGTPWEAIEASSFSPDGAHLVYQARRGDRWHLVVDQAVGEGSPGMYPFAAFDAASSRIVWVEGPDGNERGKLVVSDLRLERPQVVHPHAGNVHLDGSHAAAIAEEEGKTLVISFPLDRPGAVRRLPAYDQILQVVCLGGCRTIAFGAEKAGTMVTVLDGREEVLGPGEQFVTPLAIRPDGKAVAVGVLVGGSVRFRQSFAGGGTAAADYTGIDGIVYSADGSSVAFVAHDKDDRCFVVVNGKPGPTLDRVVSPVFTADGKRLVYRARQAGRRFVVVADREGRTVRQHPSYDQVFPVRLTPDGRSIAYGVKDGRQVAWKVEPL